MTKICYWDTEAGVQMEREATAEEIADIEERVRGFLNNSRNSALIQIDSDVDLIYKTTIGSRQAEYEAAENQAQSFKDSDYAEPSPNMVSSWASVKGWTNQQAADDILSQATSWRAAQEIIRAQRLLRKEQVRASLEVSEIETAMNAWSVFVSAIKQQLEIT